jgi:hypothetical protein
VTRRGFLCAVRRTRFELREEARAREAARPPAAGGPWTDVGDGVRMRDGPPVEVPDGGVWELRADMWEPHGGGEGESAADTEGSGGSVAWADLPCREEGGVIHVGATDSEVLFSEGGLAASDAGQPRGAGALASSSSSSGSEGIEWLRESSETGRRGASEGSRGSGSSESEDTSLGSLAVCRAPRWPRRRGAHCASAWGL